MVAPLPSVPPTTGAVCRLERPIAVALELASRMAQLPENAPEDSWWSLAKHLDWYCEFARWAVFRRMI